MKGLLTVIIYLQENTDVVDDDNIENFATSPASSINRTETITSILSTNENITTTPVLKEKRKKYTTKAEEQNDEVLSIVSERLRTCQKPDDKFSIFAQNVAAKLRGLPTRTRLFTEKLINDLLFEAEMEHINSETKIVTSLIRPSQSENNTFNYPPNCGIRGPDNSHLQMQPIYHNHQAYSSQQSSHNISNPTLTSEETFPSTSTAASSSISQNIGSYFQGFNPR